MPANSSRPPKYRHYKPKNLAVVRINGKDFYLGTYGSPESRENYGRLMAERKVDHSGRTSLKVGNSSANLTIDELIVIYWNRRVVPYYVKDGRPTSEPDNIRQALRFL